MESKPKRKKRLVVEDMDEDLLVADFRDSQMHILNPTAAAVWELCDGQHTTDQIANLLAAHFGLSEASVREDVANIVADFRNKGLVE